MEILINQALIDLLVSKGVMTKTDGEDLSKRITEGYLLANK